jgi:hypothetical protein
MDRALQAVSQEVSIYIYYRRVYHDITWQHDANCLQIDLKLSETIFQLQNYPNIQRSTRKALASTTNTSTMTKWLEHIHQESTSNRQCKKYSVQCIQHDLSLALALRTHIIRECEGRNASSPNQLDTLIDRRKGDAYSRLAHIALPASETRERHSNLQTRSDL